MSTLKTFFSPANVKLIVLGVIVALVATILFERSRITNLKVELEQSKTQNGIYERNIKVLNDSAKYWKTKDSASAVTVGLLSATSDMMKKDYANLDSKFNNLIVDYNKKVQKQTYLETKIAAQDSLIAHLSSDNKDTSKSYIANDSTLKINQHFAYDSRNYSILDGLIKMKIDSNKIKVADINLNYKFGIGVDLATYRDANGIPRVTVATKYPGATISVSGIQNVDDELKAAANKAKAKSSFGIGIMAGYGYIIGNNTTLQKGAFIGLGLSWQPKFLQFNKK